jgi:hypothetical protein
VAHGVRNGLKSSSRLGLLVAASAATVGVIYGYDQSNSRVPCSR